MYKVIKDFHDKNDNRYAYKAGDTFPRNGLSVDKNRVSELLSSNNLLGVALIKEVQEEPKEVQEEPKEEPKKRSRKE